MSRPKQYSEAFKREAVRKAESSPNVAQTARDLGGVGQDTVLLDQAVWATSGIRRQDSDDERAERAHSAA